MHAIWKSRYGIGRSELSAVGVLAAIVLIAALSGGLQRSAHISPEVRFADASPGGLSIVPASCPSDAHYTGQCSGAPPPYGRCYLNASSYSIYVGQPTTLSWQIADYEASGFAGFQYYPPSSAVITPGVGAVSMPSGNMIVSPAVDTLYSLDVTYDVGGILQYTRCQAIVTVSPVPPAFAPTDPSLSVNACVINQAFNVSMKSSDQDSATVRYNLSYPHTGTNYFTPYVAQNTWRVESRTETTPGPKTVSVYAQDPESRSSGTVSANYTCNCPAGYAFNTAPGTTTFSSVAISSMRVNWAAASGAASYKVERCTGAGCSGFAEIAAGVTNLYYDDTGLAANTIYRYRVRTTTSAYSGIGTRKTTN